MIVIFLIIAYRREYNKKTGVSSANMVNADTGINRESDAGCTTTTSPSHSLHYASVNFQMDAGFPNEATTAVNEEGTSSSDYTTVNVGQSNTYSTVNNPCSFSDASSISLVNKP
ncbi:hypothetical protein UPYG_G00054490 [Umbra pygmaea]|uniref:Uncharacterized protein n=1 Tax=Umbra pygmaea TaxID=75934 RepID=A0ABD0X7Y0_UMBPY